MENLNPDYVKSNENLIVDFFDSADPKEVVMLLTDMMSAYVNSDYLPTDKKKRDNAFWNYKRLIKLLTHLKDPELEFAVYNKEVLSK